MADQDTDRDLAPTYDIAAWPSVIRAVAAWEARQFARAHEAAGGDPLAAEDFDRLQARIEKGLTYQAMHPRLIALRAALTAPMESSTKLDPEGLGRGGEYGQELRFPRDLFVQTRWERGRVLGRVADGDPWEVIAEAPRLGLVAEA